MKTDLGGFAVVPIDDGGLWPKPKPAGAVAEAMESGGPSWPKPKPTADGDVVEATADGGPWPKMKADLSGFTVSPIDDGGL
jgi:hypothetical protein